MGILSRRLIAEAIGTQFLLVAVAGSGIMAQTLFPRYIGMALPANAIATGVALFVLITILGKVSGAQFNPAVTLVFALRHDIRRGIAEACVAVQVTAGILGGLRHALAQVPALMAAYITEAY